ncbi:MAG TPA: TlpA disulfide reductase family protein [Woeseiaceae bacterium]|nr:TlpA disulfide reductase family protein [Woeseiaceae bacterium]
MQKILIVLVLLAAAAGGWFAQQKTSEKPAAPPMRDMAAGPAHNMAAGPEQNAPAAPAGPVAFTLPDLEGHAHSLSEWDGEARLVNFWATWCAPCRREIPLLKETQAEHGDDNLQVIGIAVDEREAVLAYAESADFNYPILIGQDDAIAAAESAGVPFIGLPFTMVISADGELVKTHMGEIAAEQIGQIVDVLERLDAGDIDLAAAREELGPL